MLAGIEHYIGEWWYVVIGIVVGEVIGGISAALSGGDTVDIIIGAVAGAASGALTASGVGVVGQVIGSAAISMASNTTSQSIDILITKESEEFDTADVIFDGVVSAATAFWSGSGASYGNKAGINASWKQLFKKGISNSNARQYFAKTAHNANKKFVLTALKQGMLKNAVGTGAITGKNMIINKIRGN